MKEDKYSFTNLHAALPPEKRGEFRALIDECKQISLDTNKKENLMTSEQKGKWERYDALAEEAKEIIEQKMLKRASNVTAIDPAKRLQQK